VTSLTDESRASQVVERNFGELHPFEVPSAGNEPSA